MRKVIASLLIAAFWLRPFWQRRLAPKPSGRFGPTVHGFNPMISRVAWKFPPGTSD